MPAKIKYGEHTLDLMQENKSSLNKIKIKIKNRAKKNHRKYRHPNIIHYITVIPGIIL